MSNAAVARTITANSNFNHIAWLALTLTPGLGPTRAKRLVEFFGGVERVFSVSLTELEAAGLPAQAAQSIGTGRSVELAHDELAKAKAGGVKLVTLDDAEYPARLRQIYDPPLVLYVRGNVDALAQPGIAMIGTRHPTPYGIGRRNAWGVIWRVADWLSSAGWRVVSIRLRIVERCRPKARQSRFLAPGWTWFTQRKTRDSRTRFLASEAR